MQFSFDNVENISAYAFNLCFYRDLCRILRFQLLKPEDKGKLVHMYLTLAFTMLSLNFLRVELLKLGCGLKCNLVVNRVESYVMILMSTDIWILLSMVAFLDFGYCG